MGGHLKRATIPRISSTSIFLQVQEYTKDQTVPVLDFIFSLMLQALLLGTLFALRQNKVSPTNHGHAADFPGAQVAAISAQPAFPQAYESAQL